MDAGLKQLKVISRGEDGGWERVPVYGGHRDKRVGQIATLSLKLAKILLVLKSCLCFLKFIYEFSKRTISYNISIFFFC